MLGSASATRRGASVCSGELTNACVAAASCGEGVSEADVAIEAASLDWSLGQKKTAQKVPTISTAAAA